VGREGTMRLRGTLLWETDDASHRDDVLISDERPNGAGSRIVILNDSGEPRAESPNDLPPGSMLLLQSDASDADIGRIKHSGYAIRRVTDPALDAATQTDTAPDDVDELAESPADRKARRAAIKAAEAELAEVTDRLRRELRQRHPELFDSRGRLRRGVFARVMRERTGGKTYLTREEIIELTGGVMMPSDGPSSANAP
jgi:hypothetical protein